MRGRAHSSHRHARHLIYSSTTLCRIITSNSWLEKQARKWWHHDVTLVLIPEPGHLTTVLDFSTTETLDDQV